MRPAVGETREKISLACTGVMASLRDWVARSHARARSNSTSSSQLQAGTARIERQNDKHQHYKRFFAGMVLAGISVAVSPPFESYDCRRFFDTVLFEY